MRRLLATSTSFFLLLLSTPRPARATWSIAAADPITRQIGGAGASCLAETSVLYWLYTPVPGRGILQAQALLSGPPPGMHPDGSGDCSDEECAQPGGPRDVAAEMLRDGADPTDIIAAIVQNPPDSDCDVGYCAGETRQYGVVDLYNRAASWTGAGVHEQSIVYDGIAGFEDNRHISEGDVTFSVQGNTVTESTVEDAFTSFASGDGCDLADRLMLGIEAGAYGSGEGMGGDVRCLANFSMPALGAFLRVDADDGTKIVDIDVVDDENAIGTLRARYDEWRKSHPCPSPVTSSSSHSAGAAWGMAGAVITVLINLFGR